MYQIRVLLQGELRDARPVQTHGTATMPSCTPYEVSVKYTLLQHDIDACMMQTPILPGQRLEEN